MQDMPLKANKRHVSDTNARLRSLVSGKQDCIQPFYTHFGSDEGYSATN